MQLKLLLRRVLQQAQGKWKRAVEHRQVVKATHICKKLMGKSPVSQTRGDTYAY